MAENNYMDDASAPAAEPVQGEAKTALLPTSFFEGKELTTGSRCEVEIQAVHDGQVEVSYVPHADSEPAVDEEMPAAPPDDGMAEMMEA